MDTKDATAALEKDKKERQEKCKNEITELLEKYNCTIVSQMLLQKNGVIPIISINAK